MPKPKHLMPSGNPAEVDRFLDQVEGLRGENYERAWDLVEAIGERELFLLLHAMRRWYSSQSWNAAKKILPYAARLDRAGAMELAAGDVLGAYRGFKVPDGSPLADAEVGDVVTLPVERNGGCTSWTLRRSKANLFSGAGKGRVGLVVRLVSTRGVRPFIAPPARSAPWFNALYARTMNRSFRFKEQEYAVCGRRVTVEVVAVKRR